MLRGGGGGGSTPGRHIRAAYRVPSWPFSRPKGASMTGQGQGKATVQGQRPVVPEHRVCPPCSWLPPSFMALPG